jgi:hypothetical protein
MKPPKDLYQVDYEITDRGATHPVKSRELPVPKGSAIQTELTKLLKKDRHAMDLTTRFTVKVVGQVHVGWA